MTRTWRRIAAVAALLTLTALSDASAQQNAPRRLLSTPTGAMLRLEGPSKLEGSTPLALGALSDGTYRAIVRGPGLAVARGLVRVDGGELSLGTWSGPLALLQPPGTVHLRRGEPRGWTLLGSGILGGGLWWTTRNQREDAEDRAAAATETLASDPSAEAAARARLDLASARQRAIDEERLNNLWTTYLATAWIGAGLEAWLLTPTPVPSPSGAGEMRWTLPVATARGALARSAIHPGAGQRALGREGWASFFSFGIAAGAAASILAQGEVLDARQEWSGARREKSGVTDATELARLESIEADALQRDDDWATVRSVVVGTTVGLYAWNLIDAYFGGRRAAAEGTPGLTWKLRPHRDGVALALSRRFG